MERSAFKRTMRRRQGFTLIEVTLAAVVGSLLLATTAYTTMQMSKAIDGVYNEAFLQTVARDVQLNLDKSLGAVNKDGVPDSIAVTATSVDMGGTKMRWTDASNPTDGGKLEYSLDGGTNWQSMADIGSRGDFAQADFAYGKFAPKDDDDMPVPGKTTFTLDDRVRNQLMRVTSTLQKADMVPMYMQQVRAPRALTWSWVQSSTSGDKNTDTDGDGVMDDKDDFPLDPNRAYSERYPTTAGNTASIAYEDLYPSQGDADYNDMVSAFFIKETYSKGKKDDTVLANRPGLMEVYMRWYAQARGAGYDHAQRIFLGNLVKGGGKASVYHYDPTGRLVAAPTVVDVTPTTWVDIFDDTRTQLPPSGGTDYSNVVPGQPIQQSWSTVIQITLADPTQNRYGTTQAPPYDPFLYVKTTSQEIHMPMVNTAGGTTGIIDSYKFTDGSIKKVVDGDGNPFALLVPGNWSWPLEGQRIQDAYPQYQTWVNSNRTANTNWYLTPITDRYVNKVLNTGSKPAPSPAINNVFDKDADGNDRYVYVFDPKLFSGQGTFAAPATANTTLPVSAAPATPTPAPTPSGANSVYPIALSKDALLNKNVGDTLDILCGVTPGNFGWLSWTGDTSAPTLATSLTVPGNSYNYVNPANAADHVISIGDNIQGSTGTKNSAAVRAALNTLETYDIVVPVWDTVNGAGGAGTLYHTYAFAKVHINNYLLPGQASINATYKGYVSTAGTPSTDPALTPAPVIPSVVPSAVASAIPSVAPSPVTTSNHLMPFAVSANLVASARTGYSMGTIPVGTGTKAFCWLAWNSNTSESVWNASMDYPGNSNNYVNPSNSGDHQINPGDRIKCFTDVSNSSTNRQSVTDLAGKTLIIPVYSKVSGSQIAVSSFCKVQITGYSLSSPDYLQLTFQGSCDAAGN